jgi:hypothetical protein
MTPAEEVGLTPKMILRGMLDIAECECAPEPARALAWRCLGEHLGVWKEGERNAARRAALENAGPGAKARQLAELSDAELIARIQAAGGG